MSDDKSWVYSCLIELMNAARAHQPPDFRDATLEACRKALDQYSAERAVVEAARVLMKRCNPVVIGKRVGPLNEMLYQLKEAVEALEKAEGDPDRDLPDNYVLGSTNLDGD